MFFNAFNDVLLRGFLSRKPLLGKFLVEELCCIDWESINSILNGNIDFQKHIRLVNAQNYLTRGYHGFIRKLPGGRSSISKPLMERCIRDGCSLVVDSSENLFPNIKRVCAEISEGLVCSSGANIYVSWPHSGGFGWHFDDHDVIACQLDGSKRWKIMAPTYEHPYPGDKSVFLKVPENQEVQEFTLSKGDFLYIPGGYWHNVETHGGNKSLHVSFTMVYKRRLDLIMELERMLKEDVYFRQPILEVFFSDTDEIQIFKDKLISFIESWCIKSVHQNTDSSSKIKIERLYT